MKSLALSPFVGPYKKKKITEQWGQLESWLQGNNVDFVEGFEEVDDDLAAVIIAARSPYGSEGFRLLSFGVCLIEGEWRVAPVMASFNNTGLGFSKKTKSRIRALERWMMDKRVDGGALLKKRASDAFTQRLQGAVSKRELKNLGPFEMFDRFLAAAKDRRLEELLVWYGILEQEQWSDVLWAKTIGITEKGLSGNDERNVWRLMTDPSVVPLIVNRENGEDKASVVAIFLSPFMVSGNKERIHAVRFSLENRGVGWRIQLPAFFREANLSASAHRNAHHEAEAYDDLQITDEFGKFFEIQHEFLEAASPELLSEQLLAAMRVRDLLRIIRHVHRPGLFPQKLFQPFQDEEGEELQEFKGLNEVQLEILKEFGVTQDLQKIDQRNLERFFEELKFPNHLNQDDEILMEMLNKLEANRNDRYIDAAAKLGRIHPSHKEVRFKSVKILREGRFAISIIQIIDLNGKWDPEYEALWMYQENEIWSFLPGGRRSLNHNFEGADDLSDVVREEFENLKKDFMRELFVEVARYDAQGQALEDEGIKKAIKNYRETLQKGMIAQVLEKGALLREPAKPQWFLQDLSYAIKAARHAVQEDQILGIQTKGRLSGVSMMVDIARGEDVDCPLVIVVPTNEGPRVLLDVELWLPSNRGKMMRNADMMEVMEKAMVKEDLENLKILLEWHEKTALPIWTAWHEERAAKNKE